MQKHHTGTILTLGIVAIGTAGTLFALQAVFPRGVEEVVVDEGAVTADAVFAGKATSIAKPTAAVVAVDPATAAAADAGAEAPASEGVPADGMEAATSEPMMDPAAPADAAAATPDTAAAEPVVEPAAAEPAAAEPAVAPATAAPAPAPAAAPPTETAMATPPKPAGDATGGDPHKSEIALRWWPDAGKTPAGQLALQYAGQTAGQKAIALLFSGNVTPANVAKHVAVKDPKGMLVPGKWEASQNPRMVVFKTGKTGTFAIEIGAALADDKGRTITNALAGPVEIQ